MTVWLAHQLHFTQRSIERAMLGISLSVKVRNETIRQKTKVADIVQKCSKLKWQWAGHIRRRTDCHSSKKVLEWEPWLSKRCVERHPARRTDDFRRVAGSDWMVKDDWDLWRTLGEATLPSSSGL